MSQSQDVQERRSFLLAIGGVGVSGLLPQAQAGGSEGAVVAGSEGEHLIHFRDQGNIFIKASGGNLGLGTQQVMRGTGIPVHRHPQMDEAFYVLEGSGSVTLNDVPHAFDKGATISIPKNTWHGFANPDHELLVLWITAPAGLDAFFRETCRAPGAPAKNLSREQIREIALKHGTEFR
jgi:quercetin dioxygenase-like cupin family protein